MPERTEYLVNGVTRKQAELFDLQAELTRLGAENAEQIAHIAHLDKKLDSAWDEVGKVVAENDQLKLRIDQGTRSQEVAVESMEVQAKEIKRLKGVVEEQERKLHPKCHCKRCDPNGVEASWASVEEEAARQAKDGAS